MVIILRDRLVSITEKKYWERGGGGGGGFRYNGPPSRLFFYVPRSLSAPETAGISCTFDFSARHCAPPPTRKRKWLYKHAIVVDAVDPIAAAMRQTHHPPCTVMLSRTETNSGHETRKHSAADRVVSEI